MKKKSFTNASDDCSFCELFSFLSAENGEKKKEKMKTVATTKTRRTITVQLIVASFFFFVCVLEKSKAISWQGKKKNLYHTCKFSIVLAKEVVVEEELLRGVCSHDILIIFFEESTIMEGKTGN